MNELIELFNKCKGSVTIEHNPHKDYYSTVVDYIRGDAKQEVDEVVLAKMIDLDTIIAITFYPDTPVGFYTVLHYDLNLAVKEALNIVNIKR